MTSRHVYRTCRAIAACTATILCRAGATRAADTFSQLSSAEIRSKIVDNVVTDQAHWSDRFAADGTFYEMSLGVTRTAAWKLNGNEVCITRKTRKPLHECLEIWVAGINIEYRRGGITLMSGNLRNQLIAKDFMMKSKLAIISASIAALIYGCALSPGGTAPVRYVSVSTLTGSGTAGTQNGNGVAAQLNRPHGMAIAANGTVYASVVSLK